MGGNQSGCRDFRLNLFRQLFPKLHSHLIVRVDIPYRPLDEDLVFIQSDQTAKGFGVESLG